ncbi:MAG: DUF1080 domain-containing protein [Sphingomonadaceae bacterium]|nr:DUF1080 domain-containing protein [Sphingomonadaceae bacterium]
MKAAIALALLFAAAAPSAAQKARVPAGFTAIFDGKNLNGWHGDPAYFRVRDGVLEGGSDKPVPDTTFLILDKPYADFELRFKFRWVTPVGNSGIQFRSGQIVGNYVLAGLQANVTPITPAVERYAMLYEEFGNRLELALLGQRAEISRVVAGHAGRVVRTVLGTTNPREAILQSIKPYPEWNEDVLIVHGDHMVHAVNGLIAFDAFDLDPLGPKRGLIGIQVYKGPAMAVQYKDMNVKPLTRFPDIAGRFVSQPGPAPDPARTYKDFTKPGAPDTPLQEREAS